ncbi:unnamed protein product, partial [Anisakis simplex]|uniref:Uncharacterized protein n=1 Tax=Anisakis simplex TaxID=6269 RepID=A0A0M3J5U1_ANISI
MPQAAVITESVCTPLSLSSLPNESVNNSSSSTNSSSEVSFQHCSTSYPKKALAMIEGDPIPASVVPAATPYAPHGVQAAIAHHNHQLQLQQQQHNNGAHHSHSHPHVHALNQGGTLNSIPQQQASTPTIQFAAGASPPAHIILPPQHQPYRKPEPALRSMARRQSHTLLYVPEHRRVSTISGNSIASCPASYPGKLAVDEKLGQNVERSRITPPQSVPLVHSSPQVDNRRKSVQTGAPAIAFRPMRFERRSSQPLLRHVVAGANKAAAAMAIAEDSAEMAGEVRLRQALVVDEPSAGGPKSGTLAGARYQMPVGQCDMPRLLTKRVSWLSMKSLQDSVEPLLTFSRRGKKQNSMASGDNLNSRNDSRTNSQYGSVLQLDDSSLLEREEDTPPLDTLSWSFG